MNHKAGKPTPRDAHPLVRWLGVGVGVMALVAGVIGIFVPLLPTTPFLLLASACFLRGSERLHRWLLSQGTLGEYIRRYEAGEGIPRRAKIVGIGMLWISIGFGVFRVEPVWARLVMLAIATAVTIYLLRLPTAK